MNILERKDDILSKEDCNPELKVSGKGLPLTQFELSRPSIQNEEKEVTFTEGSMNN